MVGIKFSEIGKQRSYVLNAVFK